MCIDYYDSGYFCKTTKGRNTIVSNHKNLCAVELGLEPTKMCPYKNIKRKLEKFYDDDNMFMQMVITNLYIKDCLLDFD